MRFNHILFWFFPIFVCSVYLTSKIVGHSSHLPSHPSSNNCVCLSFNVFCLVSIDLVAPFCSCIPTTSLYSLSSEQCFPLYLFILYYIWTVINLISCLQKLIYTDSNWAFTIRPVYKGSVEYLWCFLLYKYFKILIQLFCVPSKVVFFASTY